MMGRNHALACSAAKQILVVLIHRVLMPVKFEPIDRPDQPLANLEAFCCSSMLATHIAHT